MVAGGKVSSSAALPAAPAAPGPCRAGQAPHTKEGRAGSAAPFPRLGRGAAGGPSRAQHSQPLAPLPTPAASPPPPPPALPSPSRPAVHVAARPPAPPHYAHLTLPDRHVRLHEPAHPSGHHLSGHSQRRCRDFHEGTGAAWREEARASERGGGGGGLRAGGAGAAGETGGGVGSAAPGGFRRLLSPHPPLCPRAAAPSPGPGQQGRQVHAGHFRGASLRHQGNPAPPSFPAAPRPSFLPRRAAPSVGPRGAAHARVRAAAAALTSTWPTFFFFLYPPCGVCERQ